MKTVKAVVNGDRVECRGCGALLGKIIKNGDWHNPKRYDITNKDVTCEKMIEGTEFADSEYNPTGAALEIKCKHRFKGIFCETINQIMI
jgi:hypothetical protein